MKALASALRYMDLFYTENDLEQLSDLFAKDLMFEGPFYKVESAEDYLDSLRDAPPKDMTPKILKAFADDSSACLIYQFSKAGISTPMAQLFEVEDGKITKIVLIFDTGPFS